MRRNDAAKRARKPDELPDWLHETVYREKISPRLPGTTVQAIASALSISIPYATDIRRGKGIPHPRHWKTLAQLIDITSDTGEIRMQVLVARNQISELLNR